MYSGLTTMDVYALISRKDVLDGGDKVVCVYERAEDAIASMDGAGKLLNGFFNRKAVEEVVAPPADTVGGHFWEDDAESEILLVKKFPVHSPGTINPESVAHSWLHH